MGSSCEANGQNIDPTVGGLVWVRRRNGSWWPGRILGIDELPKSLLVSRRPGTPVKLLGREDAMVDWYNLEKSKRVKAFRCGEHDECIERAKITATIPCKKVTKYARREDAILEALELESLQLSKSNNQWTNSPTNKTKNISDKLSGLEGIRRQSPNDSEEDGTEGSKKRMRGLHDLGIGRAVTSFKKKKRTRMVHVHDFLKKKNRRLQLTKVLKKTEMVTIPVTCREHMGLNGSGTEYNDLKRSFSDSTGDVTNNNINNANSCKQKEYENSSISELQENDDSSGRLFDVPFVREEKKTAGSSLELVPEIDQVGTVPHSGLVEIQESGSISSGANINHLMDTSKWQHKGKRNSRNKSKTKNIQTFLTPDDHESRKVNNTVEATGSLYDVKIEVKSDHFPLLPYRSLCSEFTGQPVTGHPVKVEVLNDAVSDLPLVNGDVETVLHASRKLRKNGFLTNKKTRKLSSLTGSKRPSEKRALTKPDLACVPLKVVFGRLYAALGITITPADEG